MGFMDDIVAQQGGGGMLGGLPASWQYTNPNDLTDAEKKMMALVGTQNPDQAGFNPLPGSPGAFPAGGAAPIAGADNPFGMLPPPVSSPGMPSGQPIAGLNSPFGALPPSNPTPFPTGATAPIQPFNNPFGGAGAPPAAAFGAGASPIFATAPGSTPGNPALPAPPVVAADDSEDDPAPAPQQASPIAVGNVQMPRIGSAAAFTPDPAALPANAQPTQGQGGLPTPPAGLGGLVSGYQKFMNRGADALGSVAKGGSLLGAVRGQYDDPAAKASQVSNMTARALIAKGVDPQTAIAAVQPGNTEMLKQLLPTLSPQSFTQETDKDGNVWNINKQTGQKTIALQAKDDKFQHVQTGESGLGQKTFGIFNTKTGETKPDAGAPAASSDGLGDMSKSGAEYLATLPKAQAGIVAGMVDGTIQPPSSFALAKPYWQAMLAAAKNVDPKFDANNWTSRHNMSNQIASSSNSSMGGILSNGKSSFKHLAEYTESAADLGNASHDYPGGSAVATAQNYLGNKTFAGSDTSAKVKAINDNLGHYGQESTKFYAGTGGGVEERMNALKEMNPTTTSSAEMAAYAAKEKSLMLDRLREKEAQIRDVMGEDYLQKHPVFTPELQKDIARIDANVAKLRGNASGTSAPASGGSKPPVVIQNGHTYNLQPDGSYK